MQGLLDFHSKLNAFVWGPPMIILLMGTGLVLTVASRGIQFRKLVFAFREVLGNCLPRVRERAP